MVLAGMEEAAKKAAELLRAFRTAGKPVFFIRHLSTRPDTTFFILGTEGTDIHSSFKCILIADTCVLATLSSEVKFACT